MASRAAFSSATALLQILVWIDKCDLPRRGGAENNRGGAGNQRGEKKHIQIQVNVQTCGKVCRGKPQQSANGLESNHQTERHAHKG